MPTYEYACTSCANEWEFEQSIRDEPLKVCPKCKKRTARRQISRGTGFILKGSGWYSDLYASPSNKPSDKKTESAEGSKSESTASEAKPASAEPKSADKSADKSAETKPSTPSGDSGGSSSGGDGKKKAKPSSAAA